MSHQFHRLLPRRSCERTVTEIYCERVTAQVRRSILFELEREHSRQTGFDGFPIHVGSQSAARDRDAGSASGRFLVPNRVAVQLDF